MVAAGHSQETTTAAHGEDSTEDAFTALTPTYGRFVALSVLGSGGMGVVISAYDPKLDRKVALKLLRPDICGRADADARLRLLREAQAMARLAHPNVVNVFEVGEAGDQLFVAMEHVEGETLASWLTTPRRVAEVLDVFVAAGRGLEAAHAAGLVHRDFKPKNVLIGSDRRPRVADFGLVVSGVARGSTQGTPAYMSPEQVSGGVVDARSDQFSYAVALWEAITGERPSSAGVAALPRQNQMPFWLEDALRRSLSSRPTDRWPSMTALVDHLDEKRRGRRRTWIAAGAIASALIAIGGLSGSSVVCEPPTERMQSLWSPKRREAIEKIFIAADSQAGELRARAASSMLDVATRAWSDMHVDVCRATRIDGRQSDTLFDLRMRCLERRFAELAATVTLLERAVGPRAIDGAVSAAAKLTPIDVCADVDALTRAAPVLESPRERIEGEALESELGALELEYRAGNIEAVLPQARSLVERAKKLGHPPLLALALHLLAQAQMSAGAQAHVLETLEALAETAARARDDERVAFALIKTAHLNAWELGRPEQALALLPAVRAATLRAGSPFSLEIDRLVGEGVVMSGAGRSAAMTERILEAKAMLEARGANEAGSPYLARLAWVEMQSGAMLIHNSDPAAIEHLDRALAIYERAYGPDHPDSAIVSMNRGEALRRAGKFEEAAESFRRAMQIVETRVGETALLAQLLAQLGNAYRELREPDRALPLLARSLELAKKILREDDPRLLGNMVGYAVFLEDVRKDEAKQLYDQIIELAERNRIKTQNVAFAFFNRAELIARDGACESAIPDYRRAIAILEETIEHQSVYLLYLNRGLGQCLGRLRRWEEAIPVLERALAAPPGRGQDQRATARFWLGRSLYESGRDRRRALEQVKTARQELAALGELGRADLVELDRWFAQTRGRGMQ